MINGKQKWNTPSDTIPQFTGLGTFVYNVRFPGQYYQAETGLFYNYFRDYDPQTGRYVQSDPIGLRGGSASTYSYANSNPVTLEDPSGLCPVNCNTVLPNGRTVGSYVRQFRAQLLNDFNDASLFSGHGAASSDFTRVYAHLENNGKADRELVLDGEYLVIGKLAWINSKEVDICLSDGITNSFRNTITLIAGNRSETIRNHLQLECEFGKGR